MGTSLLLLLTLLIVFLNYEERRQNGRILPNTETDKPVKLAHILIPIGYYRV